MKTLVLQDGDFVPEDDNDPTVYEWQESQDQEAELFYEGLNQERVIEDDGIDVITDTVSL